MQGIGAPAASKIEQPQAPPDPTFVDECDGDTIHSAASGEGADEEGVRRTDGPEADRSRRWGRTGRAQHAAFVRRSRGGRRGYLNRRESALGRPQPLRRRGCGVGPRARRGRRDPYLGPPPGCARDRAAEQPFVTDAVFLGDHRTARSEGAGESGEGEIENCELSPSAALRAAGRPALAIAERPAAPAPFRVSEPVQVDGAPLARRGPTGTIRIVRGRHWFDADCAPGPSRSRATRSIRRGADDARAASAPARTLHRRAPGAVRLRWHGRLPDAR